MALHVKILFICKTDSTDNLFSEITIHRQAVKSVSDIFHAALYVNLLILYTPNYVLKFGSNSKRVRLLKIIFWNSRP